METAETNKGVMIAIVDYEVGNVASVKNMLAKIGSESHIASDAKTLLNASKLILPGVGAFDAAMAKLNELDLISVLRDFAATGKPVLGICLGAQLLLRSSEEGKAKGLGLINGSCVRFKADKILRVPHMSWSDVKFIKEHPLAAFGTMPRFYFVHSYHMMCDDPNDVLGLTTYGYEFASAVSRSNVIGVQFHPEKSHRYGLQFLKNFVGL